MLESDGRGAGSRKRAEGPAGLFPSRGWGWAGCRACTDAGAGKAGLQVVPLPGALVGPAPSAAGIRQVSEIGS